MTVTNTTRKVREVGNGSQTAFNYSFPVLATSDLKVYKIDKTTTPETLNLKTITTDYTATINAVTEGGVVTYVVAPTANEDSFIVREVGKTQPAALPRESNFPEDTLEKQLDRSRMIDLELIEEMARTIKFPVNSTTTDIELPDPEASKLLGWNAAADAMTNYALTELTSIEADITLAGGDAHKLVKVKSSEDGYEVETFETAFQRDTDLQAGGIFKWKKGSDVASAAAVTLGDDGNFFDITGTTDITSITIKAAGTMVMLHFDGALTVTDGSNLKIRGNFLTETDESELILISDGTNWNELSRSPAVEYYVNRVTYDLTTASGTQAVTGIGFKPRAVLIFAPKNDNDDMSWGFVAGSNQKCTVAYADFVTTGNFSVGNTQALVHQEVAGTQSGVVSSFQDDGFTITWTKSSSPTGTLDVQFMAFS